jgi:hypothetical protein
VRLALRIARDGLLIAAQLRGVLPVPGLDADDFYGDTLALANLCMIGYPLNEKGKRAYVHDLLLHWVDEHQFMKRGSKVQLAMAEYFGRVLCASVGTGGKVNPQHLCDALRLIVTREGRPKGSTRANEKAETAAVKKWGALHKLYDELRLAGPTAESIEEEIRETKKSMRVGCRLREL